MVRQYSNVSNNSSICCQRTSQQLQNAVHASSISNILTG